MSILITGGAGFIGSMTNKILLESGYHTVIIDDLSTGSQNTIIGGDFFEGKIGDKSLISNILQKYSIKAVLHFSASTDLGRSFTHPAEYYKNNVAETCLLLEELVKHGVDKFVFSSSAAVYGQPNLKKLQENDPLTPNTPYGRTKLMIEMALKDFEAAYGLRSCSLRYFNAAGGDPKGSIPIDGLSETNLIPLIFKMLKNNEKKFTINGNGYNTSDGTCVRDYIHVSDLAVAHLLALRHLLGGGSSCAYNLGNGEGYSILEVVKTVEKVTGHSITTSIGPNRQGDLPVLIADASRIQNEWGWAPQYPNLETIISDAWQAYSPGENKEKVLESALAEELK